MHHFAKIGGIGAIALLAACTSGQSGVQPPVSGTTNVATAGNLQFAVGIAVVNQGATSITGLNTVTSFRTSSGLAPVLLNTPVITGPAGFLVNQSAACAAAGVAPSTTGVAGPDCPGIDAGTNTITGSLPPVQPVGQQLSPTTFGVIGGVFSYGFQPANTTNQAIGTNEAGGSRYVPFQLPFFDVADRRIVVGGPPAYTNVRDGNHPTPPTFLGANEGFVPFMNTTNVAGIYRLALTIPQSPTQNVTVSANATLNSATSPFGTLYGTPGAFVRDGAGGFTLPLLVPTGVTESIVNIVNAGGSGTCHGIFAAPYYYSILVQGSGAQNAVLPSNVGPLDATGKPTPTLCTGDALTIVAYGFDYPAFESGVGLPGIQAPPQVTPLTGANRQADVTISPALKSIY